MSRHVLKLDLNSTWWMPKLVSINQSYAALMSQSLRTIIGPLQDNWPLFHYVIGISGMLPYNRNVTLQTLALFFAYTRLYNAAASPASRLRSGSLAINAAFCKHDPATVRSVWARNSGKSRQLTRVARMFPFVQLFSESVDGELNSCHSLFWYRTMDTSCDLPSCLA